MQTGRKREKAFPPRRMIAWMARYENARFAF